MPARLRGIGPGLLVGVVLIAFFIAVAVVASRLGDHPEVLLAGWGREEFVEAATGVGLPAGWVSRYLLVLEILLAAAGSAAAWVLLRGGRRSWFRSWLAVALVLHTTMGGAVPGAVGELMPDLAGPAGLLQGLAWCALLPAAYAYPTGRFVPRWTRWLILAWAVFLLGLMLMPPQVGDGTVPAAAALLLFGSCAAAQAYRYRRVSDEVERAQQRWVGLAVALRFGYLVVSIVSPLGALMDQQSPDGLLANLVALPVSYAISASLVVAVTVAIVRHRLFDVDVWITRTLVYAVLTTFVTAVYALFVVGLGALVGGAGGVVLPLAATVAVALLVDRVRGLAQLGARRLVYGSRSEPYRVVSDLGRRLAGTPPPDAVASTIVDTLVRELKVTSVRLDLDGRTVAAGGDDHPSGPVEIILLRHGGALLGELRIAGERLDPADRDLVQELTRRAGAALHAAAVTAALRRSRLELATSREEERRRLHRDLHDGLGPTLAGLHQRIDAARRLIPTDPDRASRLLVDSGAQTTRTIAEVRELVDALRPSVLDQLGLADAIRAAAERLSTPPGPVVCVDAAITGPIGAAVEVATFRIAVEAMSNAVRHSGAATVQVELVVAGSLLHLRVLDDGSGFDPEGTAAGGGLRTMRERAEELDGNLSLTSGDGGTAVDVELPVGDVT